MSKLANAERKHIVFAGKRNSGKSSLVNRFIGQDLAIVSDIPGTTTDPVKKAMELLPFGPVVLVDTAGIDDIGDLGEQRINKSVKEITKADFVIVVIESDKTLDESEFNLFKYLNDFEIPFIVAINKSELGINYELVEQLYGKKIKHFSVSCKDDTGILELKEKVSKLIPTEIEPPLVGDLVQRHDIIVLVNIKYP